MSNKQKHRWYDVIVAWANGEEIQFNFSQSGWKDYIKSFNTDIPGFDNLNTEWRIKPKTVTKKYRMALVKPDQWRDNIITVDVTNSSIDDPAEYNTPGFIRWVGDTTEVEIEV